MGTMNLGRKRLVLGGFRGANFRPWGGAVATAGDWLSGLDSNQDKELQRLLCYHYTTGQCAKNSVTGPLVQRKKPCGLSLTFGQTLHYTGHPESRRRVRGSGL